MNLSKPLHEQVMVVIGGTSGIGLAGVNACIQAGAKVVAVGHDSRDEPAARRVVKNHGEVMIADARRPQTAEAAIEKALGLFGGFDGLYHVAGGSGRRWGDGPLDQLTDEGWQETLELNLTSLMRSNRAAIRRWIEAGQGGRILNIGSVLSASPSPRFFPTVTYAAAKGAIESFSRSIAAYYAAQRIRVNVLNPALTQTPMAQRAMEDEAILHYAQSKQPLAEGGVLSPSDYDAAVVYFLSEQSRMATGQILAIDGGWSVSEGVPPHSNEKEH